LNKLLALFAFSVLLLVPVGVQEALAGAENPNVLNNDILTPSADGIMIVDSLIAQGTDIKTSTATCPATDQVIGGGKLLFKQFAHTTPDRWMVEESVNLSTNSYDVKVTAFENIRIEFQAFAICAGITTLFQMVGGMLLDIDSWAVLGASIGTNPVITGLVALSMAGVAGQTAWFIHRRKKKILNS